MNNENFSNNSDKQQVIDPSNPNYKTNMYFKQNRQSASPIGNYHLGCRLQGCGCTIGCLFILIISFLITVCIWWIF